MPLKCTIVLNPAEIAAQLIPDKPRVVLRIRVADRIISADITGESLRRAQRNISDAGTTESVVAVLQGKLLADNSLDEAGLSVQPKISPVAPSPPATISHPPHE